MATTITVRNNITSDLGALTDEQSTKIEAILRDFMAKVMKLHQREVACLDHAAPDREKACGTCALSPATHSWPGFVSTTYNFVRAFAFNQLFLCHHNQPGWKQRQWKMSDLKPCMSYVELSALCTVEMTTLALDALEKIHRIAPPITP